MEGDGGGAWLTQALLFCLALGVRLRGGIQHPASLGAHTGADSGTVARPTDAFCGAGWGLEE